MITRSLLIKYGGYKNRVRMVAHAKLEKLGTQAPYFAVGADISHSGNFVAGGCLHDEVAKYIPKWKPLLKWHLCTDGIPMAYVANAVYWCELDMGISQFQDPKSCWHTKTETKVPRGYDSFFAVALSHACCEALDDAKEFEERLGAWRCQHFNNAPQSGRRDFEEWLRSREPRLTEAFRADMSKFGITETP